MLLARLVAGTIASLLFITTDPTEGAQPTSMELAEGMIRQHCVDCHGGEEAEAGVDLDSLLTSSSVAAEFRAWQKVVSMLETGRMPPATAEQLTSPQRKNLISVIQGELRRAAEEHAGDPGPVVMRRLTSAEYAYTIRDLTGLDLGLADGFVSDAVGGEGFTNAGIAQFVQDSTIERYLEAARRVADHAVIGAGPLRFYHDPGQTGFELSAITRIQDIYRRHGFRQAAGEGGEAFGLEKYPRAFFVAWQFRHRERLGLQDRTLADLAADEGIDARFGAYIWSLLNSDVRSFPTSEIISSWREFPAPAGDAAPESVRDSCQNLFEELHEWQMRFGINADAKEEAPVLAADSFDVSAVQPFEMNVNWPEGTQTAHVQFRVESADGDDRPSVVVWRAPTIRFRIPDKREKKPQPLRPVLLQDDVDRLKFGVHPRDGTIDANDFVTTGSSPVTIRVPVPEGARSARLYVDAELDVEHGRAGIVRCTILQREETDQGKSVSALLADPQSPDFDRWKAGVLEFARRLPQISHREPAPSDRDPIPPPFDATYNNPERNHFHYRIKYHRDDRFLVENILDDPTRVSLNQSWFDLLGSFEYHDAWLLFIAEKYELDLGGRRVADLEPEWIDDLPSEPREFVQELEREYKAVRRAFRRAEAGHLSDVLQFAGRAWRRPLSGDETVRLRSYYDDLRNESRLDHGAAIRALLTRVLLAPAFLYRTERRSDGDGEGPLSNWELANRLSYFLWSSVPDDELRRVAENGELTNPAEIAAQARRMLGNEKSRRFAAEFFGQWFGFYRFDGYSGIDPQRFPEFTDSLRSAMYDESVLFFDHIVREDRPVFEILSADYAFLNHELAKHYRLDCASDLPNEFQRIENVDPFERGGLLSLGAVLTLTSAPLRTSPVKRGDWILRRVLGTPVPPPPPDAGSISPDDQPGDGLSVKGRLDAHRREASCANCHSRIDPLGFALEQFDPIGRLRTQYRNGAKIDASGVLRDGTEIDSFSGLNDYIATQRDLFYRNLCRKLIGYALGRGIVIGDLMLTEEMVADLQQGAGVAQLVERIVTSRQFRYHGAED